MLSSLGNWPLRNQSTPEAAHQWLWLPNWAHVESWVGSPNAVWKPHPQKQSYGSYRRRQGWVTSFGFLRKNKQKCTESGTSRSNLATLSRGLPQDSIRSQLFKSRLCRESGSNHHYQCRVLFDSFPLRLWHCATSSCKAHVHKQLWHWNWRERH